MGNKIHKGKKIKVADASRSKSIDVETSRNYKLSTIYERHEENYPDVSETQSKSIISKVPSLLENGSKITTETMENIQSSDDSNETETDNAIDNDNICE